MIQGKFVGNEGILYGGGAFTADAASVSDTLFDNNVVAPKVCLGGGLAVGVATSITGQTVITNSIFTDNMADSGSAVMSLQINSVTGGRFTGNICGSLLCGAGALVVVGSQSDGISMNVSDVQFIGNSASNSGSGIAGAIVFHGALAQAELVIVSLPGIKPRSKERRYS